MLPAILKILWVVAVNAETPCPEGTIKKSQATPDAREEWCALADGSRHGVRRAWYADGRLWFEGEYLHGKRAGAWTFWFPNGAVMAVTRYADDVAEGPMTRFKDTGTKELEGTCRQGREDDTWTRYWPNGKVELVVTFKDGAPYGPAQYFSRRGRVIPLEQWLAEKRPGVVPGTAAYSKTLAEHRPEVLFTECRR